MEAVTLAVSVEVAIDAELTAAVARVQAVCPAVSQDDLVSLHLHCKQGNKAHHRWLLLGAAFSKRFVSGDAMGLCRDAVVEGFIVTALTPEEQVTYAGYMPDGSNIPHANKKRKLEEESDAKFHEAREARSKLLSRVRQQWGALIEHAFPKPKGKLSAVAQAALEQSKARSKPARGEEEEEEEEEEGAASDGSYATGYVSTADASVASDTTTSDPKRKKRPAAERAIPPTQVLIDNARAAVEAEQDVYRRDEWIQLSSVRDKAQVHGFALETAIRDCTVEVEGSGPDVVIALRTASGVREFLGDLQRSIDADGKLIRHHLDKDGRLRRAEEGDEEALDYEVKASGGLKPKQGGGEPMEDL